MKINLTKSELLAILSDHFKHGITDVSIAKPENNESLGNRIERGMSREFSVMPPVIGRKIEAIKYLREVVSTIEGVYTTLGLKEAKDAIENWDTWIQFVKENNRFPVSALCGGSIIFQ